MSQMYVDVKPLVARMSEEEIREAKMARQGVCLACGELASSCEDNARADECKMCGTPAVYGIAEAVTMGGLAMVVISELVPVVRR